MTLELFDGETHVANTNDNLRAEYQKASVDPSVQAAFPRGEATVTNLLNSLTQGSAGAADDRKKKWADAYAANVGPTDSGVARQRIFLALGGLDTTTERDLDADVQSL